MRYDRCRVCERPITDWARSATCSPDCGQAWRVGRHLLDPYRARAMAHTRARSIDRHPLGHTLTQQRWAGRVLSGHLRPTPTSVSATSEAFRAVERAVGSPELAVELIQARTGAITVDLRKRGLDTEART